LLANFFEAVRFITKKGFVLREMPSGIGYIDIAVIFSSTMHLVEMKVLTSKFSGPSQLEIYMKTEKRREGWLVVFDARDPKKRKQIVPSAIVTDAGKVKVITIDINPKPPSEHSKSTIY
jgi:hypothetical protein